MRSLVFLSVGATAAGFSFTGVPSSVSTNQASSATLIRDSSDPTDFSLLLRLTSQNGGSTIQEFSSEQETNIPFSFTPTESGVFIIEVISNLSPISDTQEPDKIYASSSSINVAADNQASLPSSTSSSENAGTSSSSLISTAVTSSPASTSQTTTSSNNGNTVSTTTSTSTLVTSNGDTPVAATAIQSDTASLTTTNHLASSTEGSDGKGALASDSSESSTVVSVTESSTIVSVSGTARSTNDSPTSTATLAPTAATSNSLKIGMIVGIILGILAFVGLCLALLVAYTRSRRRQRTDAFKRQLMTRQISPLVFNRMTSSPSSSQGDGSGDGDGYREYVPEEDYSRNVIETGIVQIAVQEESSSLSHLNSMYSEQSVHSVYSDSPSVFYTAVPIPRAVGATTSAPSQTSPPPAPRTFSYSALDLTSDSDLKVLASISNTPSTSVPVASDSQFNISSSQPASTSTLPQLAPGWIFPRIQPRLSQLPLPKTDRQMDIHDRKVRLQGKLIGLQGWGNVTASESQKAEMKEVSEQIRRLETLENSDWALGRSNEVPIWGLGLS
ncbi:hypothetical protein EV368DRAFT_83114 [Lentinula lateritia]|nr:hypothetical protein EV368DRAFT_83114 [Lentinula lateritia]